MEPRRQSKRNCVKATFDHYVDVSPSESENELVLEKDGNEESVLPSLLQKDVSERVNDDEEEAMDTTEEVETRPPETVEILIDDDDDDVIFVKSTINDRSAVAGSQEDNDIIMDDLTDSRPQSAQSGYQPSRRPFAPRWPHASASPANESRRSPRPSPSPPPSPASDRRRKAAHPQKVNRVDESAMDEVDRKWAEWERLNELRKLKRAAEATVLDAVSSPSGWEQLEIPDGAEVQAIWVTTRSGAEKGAERRYLVDDSADDRLFDDMLSFTEYEWIDLMTYLRDRFPRCEADWMSVAAAVGRTEEACRSAFRWVRDEYWATTLRTYEEDMYY